MNLHAVYLLYLHLTLFESFCADSIKDQTRASYVPSLRHLSQAPAIEMILTHPTQSAQRDDMLLLNGPQIYCYFAICSMELYIYM